MRPVWHFPTRVSFANGQWHAGAPLKLRGSIFSFFRNLIYRTLFHTRLSKSSILWVRGLLTYRVKPSRICSTPSQHVLRVANTPGFLKPPSLARYTTKYSDSIRTIPDTRPGYVHARVRCGCTMPRCKLIGRRCGCLMVRCQSAYLQERSGFLISFMESEYQ